MGWYYTHGATRGDIITELTTDTVTEERIFRTLRKCFRGNTMYALHESGKPGETKKWIAVYLLQRGAKDYPGWGYKGMDETQGPCEKDCPVSYLDEADGPMGGFAVEWREACRERAAKRASKKPKVGEAWSLVGCLIDKVDIVSLQPLRGTHRGTTYRIKRSLLGEKVEELAS